MKGDTNIVDILNALLAGELTAVDQYLIHGEMYADMGFAQLAEKALHESEHERQHARALIQRILQGDPVQADLLGVAAVASMNQGVDQVAGGVEHLQPLLNARYDLFYKLTVQKHRFRI